MLKRIGKDHKFHILPRYPHPPHPPLCWQYHKIFIQYCHPMKEYLLTAGLLFYIFSILCSYCRLNPGRRPRACKEYHTDHSQIHFLENEYTNPSKKENDYTNSSKMLAKRITQTYLNVWNNISTNIDNNKLESLKAIAIWPKSHVWYILGGSI